MQRTAVGDFFKVTSKQWESRGGSWLAVPQDRAWPHSIRKAAFQPTLARLPDSQGWATNDTHGHLGGAMGRTEAQLRFCARVNSMANLFATKTVESLSCTSWQRGLLSLPSWEIMLQKFSLYRDVTGLGSPRWASVCGVSS